MKHRPVFDPFSHEDTEWPRLSVVHGITRNTGGNRSRSELEKATPSYFPAARRLARGWMRQDSSPVSSIRRKPTLPEDQGVQERAQQGAPFSSRIASRSSTEQHAILVLDLRPRKHGASRNPVRAPRNPDQPLGTLLGPLSEVEQSGTSGGSLQSDRDVCRLVYRGFDHLRVPQRNGIFAKRARALQPEPVRRASAYDRRGRDAVLRFLGRRRFDKSRH